MPLRAVSFDLDGTLFRSTPLLFREALRRVVGEDLAPLFRRQRELLRQGDPKGFDWEHLIGAPLAPTYRAILQEHALELRAEAQRVLPLIQALRSIGVRLLVATDGYAIFQSSVLEIAGLEFDQLLSPEQTGFLKADPRYWHNLPPLIHLGDSPLSDIQGPREAGLRAIWVSSARLADYPQALEEEARRWGVVPSPALLPEAVFPEVGRLAEYLGVG
jgi:FMN phosphatase YigB (HAD superfamily)